MMTEREEILEERRKLRTEYPTLFDAISELLFREDPMSINFETNTDEYEPEVGTILSRLPTCSSEEDVLRIVHEEFVRWFDPDTAGPAFHYAAVSKEIWKHWMESQQTEQGFAPHV